MKNVTYNADQKFDIQLDAAIIAERRLGEIFTARKIEKIELKTENWQWEKTGNICIEFRQNGKPSGIAVTEADYWVHELRRGEETLVYLMFPIDRFKALARKAFSEGRVSYSGGDGGRFANILIPLTWIIGETPPEPERV